MLCSSCGHDNPRENRYCGMCGTPFPHRFLPAPEEQSALTFSSAPIEIAPSPLPVPAEFLTPSAPLIASAVEEVLPAREAIAPASLSEGSQPTVVEEPAPVVAAESDLATPLPAEIPVIESAPIVEAGEPKTPPVAAPVRAHVPVEEIVELATAPEIIQAEPAPGEARPAVAASTAPPVAATSIVHAPLEMPAPPPIVTHAQPAPITHEHEAVPAETSHLPEIRRYATPHREAPPAHVEAATRKPPTVQRPPAPQSLEAPPDSAGMPTFQSVVEAAGAPPISPFEPPVSKDADEERELQEYIASFQYHPPDEAVDELTMRSEVPVLDAEAPVTASHPSFDDDVPPPPEAGPHPTGEEYYPSTHAPADRSRYLEIGDTGHAGSGHHASSRTSRSILGLDDASADSAVPPDELAGSAHRHWLLWTSLIVLFAAFAAVGFYEGRAHWNHAYQDPIGLIQKEYATLRQWISEMTASPPPSAGDKQAAEVPAKVEPQTKSPATDQSAETAGKAQPESSANTNPTPPPAIQPAVTAEQQPKSATPTPQSTPSPDNKAAAAQPAPTATATTQKTTADTQTNPPPTALAGTHEPTSEPPPAVSKPRSKLDPGQEELAKAMQASDPAAAAAWLWKATSRGNPVAPVRLADMYIKGKGVPHSCEQALVLLRSEANKENAPARNRLAALYANGTCVARDRVKAYQLMSSALAVDPTSEWAQQNRKQLWQEMSPSERTLAEKFR